MPLCSELMSRPKKAVAGSRPERTTPGGSSRAGRGRQYCKLRWLLSPVIGIFQCIFELKMPRPVIWQRFTSTNSCHEPPLDEEEQAPHQRSRDVLDEAEEDEDDGDDDDDDDDDDEAGFY